MNAPSADRGPFPHAPLFADIRREWNAAEETIKLSEQISLNISIPAITELRYAGRRLIDALDIAHADGSPEKISAVLEDARFCCHRARHDSIDAAMAKIGIDLDNMTHRLGYDAVCKAYPEFYNLYTAFAAARAKIVCSRRDRQNRNTIYDTVRMVDFPALARQYTDLMACRPIALEHAAKRRRERIGWWVLLVVTIATMLFAALAVDWPRAKAQIRSHCTASAAAIQPTAPRRA